MGGMSSTFEQRETIGGARQCLAGICKSAHRVKRRESCSGILGVGGEELRH